MRHRLCVDQTQPQQPGAGSEAGRGRQGAGHCRAVLVTGETQLWAQLCCVQCRGQRQGLWSPRVSEAPGGPSAWSGARSPACDTSWQSVTSPDHQGPGGGLWRETVSPSLRTAVSFTTTSRINLVKALSLFRCKVNMWGRHTHDGCLALWSFHLKTVRMKNIIYPQCCGIQSCFR